MADSSGRANLIHNSSTKTKRIVRSVLGAETIGMSNAADIGISLRIDIDDMTGHQLPLHMLTDSETLFSFMIKSTTTSELRLMIDIAAAKQSFDRHEIATMAWIQRNQNIADSMTKLAPNPLLVEFMKTNRLSYDVLQTVLRTNTKNQDNRLHPFADSTNAIEDFNVYLANHGLK